MHVREQPFDFYGRGAGRLIIMVLDFFSLSAESCLFVFVVSSWIFFFHLPCIDSRCNTNMIKNRYLSILLILILLKNGNLF